MSLVCIDCRYINGRPSGIAEMTAALVAHLPQMAPDLGFRLLASPDARGRLSHAPNVEQQIVRAAANGPGTMWWLPRLADLRGVDLFHATFNIMPGGLTMPCITTIHDLMWLTHPNWCETGWRRPLRQAFFTYGISRALTRSAAIATVSEATRSVVVTARPSASRHIVATPSGVSSAFRRAPPSPTTMTALGLDPKRRFVLTVGQNAPYKNHTGVLQAFALACGERSDIDLVLVQRQGRQAQALLALAAQLGVARRVLMLPALARNELIYLYSSATMLLHPSLCEGFGHPLAEAMACGCPVITSNRSAMPEVTAHAALLVDPDDHAAIASAIDLILDDPELAEELRERGYKRAVTLRWEKFAQANLQLYRHVLATRASV